MWYPKKCRDFNHKKGEPSHMKTELIKQKKDVIKVTKSLNNLMNKVMILDLLSNDKLDELINKLKEEKIKITHPTIFEKKYLTSYEQFLYVLDNFITYMIRVFNNVEIVYTMLPSLIKENNDILFSKYYFYTSYNTKKYLKGYNKMISYNFYNNCLILEKELTPFFNSLDIKITKLNIDEYSDSMKIVSILEEIYFISRNNYGTVALFEKITDSNYNLMSTQYDRLFYSYEKNFDFIKEYRKFKEKNNMYI